MTKTTKLDVYIHYNFSSLAAENVGEITPRWANGGGNKPSADLINLEDIALDLTGNRDGQGNGFLKLVTENYLKN